MQRLASILAFLGMAVCTTGLCADPCRVEHPGEFAEQVQRLKQGNCTTLLFTRTMDIELQSPIRLDGNGGPIVIEAEEGIVVRLLGAMADPDSPGIWIQRDDVTLRNFKLRDFPETAVRIEADAVTLEGMEISRSGTGVSVLRGEGISIRRSDLHHHDEAAVSWGKGARVLLSEISFHDNETLIQIEGPHLRTPQNLVGFLSGDRMIVSGHVVLSRREEDPYRLGPIRYRDLTLEIYRGGRFIGRIEDIDDEGLFRAEWDAQESRGDWSALLLHEGMSLTSPLSEKAPLDPEADADGDGLTNLEEDRNHNGRLDPGESDPRLTDTDGDKLNDSRERQLGSDPQNRDTDGDGLIDGREVVQNWDPLRADTDGDGLEDGVESEAGTDPAKPDTDNDGLNDGDEIMHGSDPLRPDSDDDGAKDGQEVLRFHTDPLNPDTDADGLKDGLDPDPLETDADGDGLEDGIEDANHNGRLDPNETDPGNADTDGDGLSDGEEGLEDDDGDGFVNARDLDSDNNGCPDEARRGCSAPSSAPPPSPLLPNEGTQEKSSETILPSEVIPARGGGACQLNRRIGRPRGPAILILLSLCLVFPCWRIRLLRKWN